MSDFNNGAKAMFDYVTGAIANHYHGKPEIQKLCDIENEYATEVIQDALEEVSPKSHTNWKSIITLKAKQRDMTKLIAEQEVQIIELANGLRNAVNTDLLIGKNVFLDLANKALKSVRNKDV